MQNQTILEMHVNILLCGIFETACQYFFVWIPYFGLGPNAQRRTQVGPKLCPVLEYSVIL
jgi:hypothetical protein